MCVILRKPIIT